MCLIYNPSDIFCEREFQVQFQPEWTRAYPLKNHQYIGKWRGECHHSITCWIVPHFVLSIIRLFEPINSLSDFQYLQFQTLDHAHTNLQIFHVQLYLVVVGLIEFH
jgi:hypothetical protein